MSGERPLQETHVEIQQPIDLYPGNCIHVVIQFYPW